MFSPWKNGGAKLVPLNPKYLPSGGDQVVIAVGKAACKNALPNSAGLNTFCPNPPHIALPIPIATNPPKKTIHKGKPGGRVNANNNPVIKPLPSFNDLNLSSCLLLNNHSVNIQENTAVRVTSNADRPK